MATVRIVLQHDIDQQTHKQVVYRGGEVIRGHLEIIAKFDRRLVSVLSFEGSTRCWLRLVNHATIGTVVSICEHQFLKQIQELQIREPNHRVCNDQYLYQEPFEFVIPRALISPYSDVPFEFLRLLPSMKAGESVQPTPNRPSYMQPLISYILRASVSGLQAAESFSQDYKLTCEREIDISPLYQVAPPLQIAYYPKEFRPSCNKPLKKHTWSRSVGTLSISASEPQPLNISTSAPRATTMVHMELTFHASSYDFQKDPPSEWKVIVKSSIRTKTFFTTHKFAEIPTVVQALRDPYLKMQNDYSTPEARELADLSWKSKSCSFGRTAGNQVKSWITTVKLPVNGSKDLVPSFLSSLCARRYSLVLQVRIVNWCHDVIEVDVPIQIINSPIEEDDPLKDVAAGIMASRLNPAHLERSVMNDRPPPYTRAH